MRYSDFGKNAQGKLVPTVYGARAFVPDPLPPTLQLEKFAMSLAEVSDAIGELRGACRKLVNPYVLIQPLQRLEAQTTSAMEGTYTTADALARTEAGLAKDPSDDDREAYNFIRALTWARAQMKDLPISGRLLKGAHRILLDGVSRGRGRDAQPGEYARDQNMIGGTRIETARFIPPPPDSTLEAMSLLEAYINRDFAGKQHGLIDLALVHYQFETIHPFGDGNGRLGRMLITLMAMSHHLLDLPVLYMSPELERRKDEYIEQLYSVSCRGTWEAWLSFFFEVMAASCRRTTAMVDQVIYLQITYQERVKQHSRSTNLLIVTDSLFDQPYTDASDVARRLGVSDTGARKILKQLVDLDILRELDMHPKIWMAPEILKFSEPEP